MYFRIRIENSHGGEKRIVKSTQRKEGNGGRGTRRKRGSNGEGDRGILKTSNFNQVFFYGGRTGGLFI